MHLCLLGIDRATATTFDDEEGAVRGVPVDYIEVSM